MDRVSIKECYLCLKIEVRQRLVLTKAVIFVTYTVGYKCCDDSETAKKSQNILIKFLSSLYRIYKHNRHVNNMPNDKPSQNIIFGISLNKNRAKIFLSPPFRAC